MIEELRLGNYRSFKDLTILPLRPITIFLGRNNSGKTAALRAPLLILNALAKRSGPGQSAVPLRVRDLRYGDSLNEVAYRETPHLGVQLGITCRPSHGASQSTVVDVRIQLNQSIRGQSRPFVSEFTAPPFVYPIKWRRSSSESDAISYTKAVSHFEGLLPVGSSALNGRVAKLNQQAEGLVEALLHLTSIRAALETSYSLRPPELSADTSGREAPYLLADDALVEELVSDWYREKLLTRGLGADLSSNSFSINTGSSSSAPSLARSGQGLQQVFPVVTLLCGLIAERVDASTLVVEEPELHLHPSVHGDLCDLFIRAHHGPQRPQILIETHSENFVLRLRRRVAEGLLAPDDVRILWLDGSAGASTVETIDIRRDGSVSKWPRGVFEEDLSEVRAIVRASAS